MDVIKSKNIHKSNNSETDVYKNVVAVPYNILVKPAKLKININVSRKLEII